MDPSTASEPPSPSEDAQISRSRASSVVSTGTKTSIGTLGTFMSTNTGALGMTPVLATEEQTTSGNSIDVLLGRRNFRISARPGSILSISSFDFPAPPYHEAIRTPAVPWNHTNDGSHNRHDLVEHDSTGSGSTLTDDDRPTTADTVVASAPPSRPAARIGSPDISYPVMETPDHDTASTTTLPPSILPFSRSESEAARNAMSRYYTDIVRQIDSNHQAAMAQLQASHDAHVSAQRTELEVAHETELDDERAALRREHEAMLSAQRNEIDATYRQEFARMRQEAAVLSTDKARLEETVSAAEERTRSLETQNTEAREKIRQLEFELEAKALEAETRERTARNQVEDLWEGRWKQLRALDKEQVGKAKQECTIWSDAVEEKWDKEIMLQIQEVVRERLGAYEAARNKEKDVAASPVRKRLWPSFGSAASRAPETKD